MKTDLSLFLEKSWGSLLFSEPTINEREPYYLTATLLEIPNRITIRSRRKDRIISLIRKYSGQQTHL
jgi:hypothetical protein